jgi:hypothetical protein
MDDTPDKPETPPPAEEPLRPPAASGPRGRAPTARATDELAHGRAYADPSTPSGRCGSSSRSCSRSSGRERLGRASGFVTATAIVTRVPDPADKASRVLEVSRLTGPGRPGPAVVALAASKRSLAAPYTAWGSRR